MKISTESAGERELLLTIEVEEERVERAKKQTARQISRDVEIPGFRKGKAPYDVVVQRLGARVVRQEMVGRLAEDVYREALEAEGVTPYAPGTLEETSFDPLRLTFIVPLAPEVDLGAYRDYRLEAPEVEVPDEMLDEALEGIRQQNAVLAPLDRPAGEGDLLVGELTGRLSDGTVFLQEEEARILLDSEEGPEIPGLIEGLIGLEAGDEHTFSLLMPEDFEADELAGQEATFDVQVDQVYERILPELDDDLARTVGNYDTFEEMKDAVRERLKERQRAQAEGDYAEDVLADIIEGAEISYPSVMLEEALDDAVENYEHQIEHHEHMMMEDYLRIQGRTKEDVREELEPDVRASLERSLVLGEIVEQEDLEVSEEALDVQIAESAEQYGERAEEVRAALSEPQGRRNFRNRMLANMAIERLVAIAKGEAPEPGVAAEDVPDTPDASEAGDVSDGARPEEGDDESEA